MSGQSGSASDGWDEFLSGLKVMVVDDDPLCLKVVEQMLKKCSYTVTTCPNGVTALEVLRDKNQHFDLVLSDVYMPDVDGFKLLELIGLELDLPVIMMSSNGETSVVLRGVTHGAVDFLIKPVRIRELRNVWQHVVRRKRDQIKDIRESISDEDGDEATGGLKRGSGDKKRKGDRREFEDERDCSVKKPRVVWSVEMHQQFVNAVNQLGIDKAVPKRILDLMNVEGLTRENVASHLQKYRLYLKRVSGVSPAPGGKGLSCQPEWPPMMGAGMHPGMGQQPAAMLQGAGLHGAPMSNLSNQQMMHMQMHGVDLHHMGMGISGSAPLRSSAVNPGMHLGLGVATGAAATISPGMQAANSSMPAGPAALGAMHGVNSMRGYGSTAMGSMTSPGLQRMPIRTSETPNPVLMNSIMSNGLYVDPDPSSHHLAAENLITALEGSGLHQAPDVPSYEQQLQHQHLHLQPHASRDASLSSDIAQNTHLPCVGSAERRSRGSGEESVGNDFVVKPEESMDDILRFFLKDA